MKRLLLIPLLLILFTTCEDVDDTPPAVTITSPQDGSTVFEVVTITCISTDNEGVEKVELWVDGVSTGITDNTEPYSLTWNTTTYDNGPYTLTVRSYDINTNKADSDPVNVIVDNSLSLPKSVSVKSVDYTIEELSVIWEQSKEIDFKEYRLYYSLTETGEKTLIQTYSIITDTLYQTNVFDPNHENWYWVEVVDTYGYSSIGIGLSNEVNTPPTAPQLFIPLFKEGSFEISWSKNTETDYLSYKLYENDTENLIYESTDRMDTSYVQAGINQDQRINYKLVVEDYFGLSTSSETITGSSYQKIVYTSEPKSEDTEINIMDIDGELKAGLTNNDSWEYRPMFSPDGTAITFYSNMDGNYDIYKMEINGNNLINLTENDAHNLRSQFSPDGSKIVFTSNISGNTEIYIMNSNGSNQSRLTTEGGDVLQFSPDGSKLLFSSDRNGSPELYIMNIDGSNQTVLTDFNGRARYSSFSPDGSKIIFIAGTDTGERWVDKIYTMDVNGANQVLLIDLDSQGGSPNFSPDGSKIAFYALKGNTNSIYEINADGSNLNRLTDDNYNDYFPQYSQDGNQILYVSSRGTSNREIIIMNSDGSNSIRLTNNDRIDDDDPQFQPRP